MSRSGVFIISKSPSTMYSKIAEYYKNNAIKNVIIVQPKGCNYKLPDGAVRVDRYVSFTDYYDVNNIAYMESLDISKTLLIVFEISDMVGNRLDKRLDHIQVRYKCKHKIVCDTLPYKKDPWKIYFPYSCFNKPLLGYGHSYAIERDYNKFIAGDTKYNPCDVAKLVSILIPSTYIDYKDYFDKPYRIEVHATTDKHKKEYFKLKDHLFETETSISVIKRKLFKYSDSVSPTNALLNTNKIYSTFIRSEGEVVFKINDLKIDSYLMGAMEDLIATTNNLTRGFYEEIHK